MKDSVTVIKNSLPTQCDQASNSKKKNLPSNDLLRVLPAIRSYCSEVLFSEMYSGHGTPSSVTWVPSKPV